MDLETSFVRFIRFRTLLILLLCYSYWVPIINNPIPKSERKPTYLVITDDFNRPPEADGTRRTFIHPTKYSPTADSEEMTYDEPDFYGEAGDRIIVNFDTGYDSRYPNDVGFGTFGTIVSLGLSDRLTETYGEPVYELVYTVEWDSKIV